MKKEYLKDIAFQMCQVSLRNFDLFALDDSKNISDEDKQYILDKIEKEANLIQNKIKDANLYEFYSTSDLVDYCADKELL